MHVYYKIKQKRIKYIEYLYFLWFYSISWINWWAETGIAHGLWLTRVGIDGKYCDSSFGFEVDVVVISAASMIRNDIYSTANHPINLHQCEENSSCTGSITQSQWVTVDRSRRDDHDDVSIYRSLINWVYESTTNITCATMSQSFRSESSVSESNIAVNNCGLRGNNIFAKHDSVSLNPELRKIFQWDHM